MRYSVNLTEKLFEFVCHFQSLDVKGRELVMELIYSEEERYMKEKESRGYDAEKYLEEAEDEIGFEFD